MVERAFTFGIDFGGTFTKLALVSAGGEILERRRITTDTAQAPREFVAVLRPILEEMSAAQGLAFGDAAGIGIGIPAVVDHRTGWVSNSGTLGWKDVPLGEIAREVLGRESLVDDDVAAGALADLHFGCARDASDLLYVAWGTGIGAGIVIDRRVYHSRGGASNELGHMPADPTSSRLCYCGCRGCLEIEAGGKAMLDQFVEAVRRGEPSALGVADASVERMAGAAARGDLLSRRIFERSATLLARVLAGALALLNPDTVVFGGGVSRCFPLIQETFDRELRARAPAFSLRNTRIAQSAFGAWAGAVGAASLPRRDEP